jgi:hypothetical protein
MQLASSDFAPLLNDFVVAELLFCVKKYKNKLNCRHDYEPIHNTYCQLQITSYNNLKKKKN